MNKLINDTPYQENIVIRYWKKKKHHPLSSDFKLAQMAQVQGQDIFLDGRQAFCQVLASNNLPIQDMV